MRRHLSGYVAIIGALVLIAAAVFVGNSIAGAKKPVIHLNFETQPDPPITQFWKGAAKKWNATHPNIQVNVGVTPDIGGTIEYPLLTALANGTGPDITDALWTGFGAELVKFDRVANLSKMPGFTQLIKTAHLTKIAPQYSYHGVTFAIPEYLNPTMTVWNKDLLDQMGVSTPPRTYGELLALAPKLPSGVFLTDTPPTPLWWQMWFSFIGPYYAASAGQPYWNDKQALFNNSATRSVLNFVQTVFAKKLAPTQTYSDDPVATGKVLGYSSLSGPWSLPYWKSTYPNFHYVLTPPLVPDNYPANKQIYNYGDSKGIGVLTKDPAKVAAAWQFLSWYFKQPKLQAQFFQLSNLPPARDDLTTNPAFQSVVGGNPALQQFLKQVPYSKLMVANPQSELLQGTFNSEVWDPLVQGKASVDQAIANGTKKINKILQGH